jgi:sugar lactone lactonase YvrE
VSVSDLSAAPSWRVVVSSASEVGERPVWDARTHTLVWPDILAGTIHRSDPSVNAGDLWLDATVKVGAVVGAVALREDGGMVAAVDGSIRMLDRLGCDDADEIPLAVPEGHRFNDGACDPAGRFLVGTGGSTPTGVLWSVSSDGSSRVVLDEVTESNGLGWSTDGATIYYIDSTEPVVRQYAYDVDDGVVGARQSDLIDLSDRPGVPDGLVVDALGHVWVPQWQGAELACFDPSGAVVKRWQVPVTQPTCPGFSGDRLDRLVVATGWEGMTVEERAAEPWAGHLLQAGHVRVRGREAQRFTSGR